MRNFLLFTLVIASISLYGQRKENGWALQARYGIMEGKGETSGIASELNFGTSVTIGKRGALAEANLFLQDYYVDKDNLNLPYKLYGLNALGGWSYEGVRNFYFNIKGGVFIGVENVNNGNTTESQFGTPLAHPINGFTYGFLVAPEVEIKVWDRLTLLVNFNQYWNRGSEYANWKYSVNAGLKYYL